MSAEENFEDVIKELRDILNNLILNKDYPDGKIRKVEADDIISGTAFFPVGDGFIKPIIKFPKIMVLGQDFGPDSYIDKIPKSEIQGEFSYSKTWAKIKSIFDEAHIPM